MMFMRRKEFFLVILITLIASGFYIHSANAAGIIPAAVIGTIRDTFYQVLEILNVPMDWRIFPKVITHVIVPVLSIWVIIYAFLNELRIFRRTRWVNPVLSLLMTISTIPLGLFYIIVNFLFTFSAIWAVIVFVLMFTVGIWLLYKKRTAEWGTGAAVAGAHQEMVKGLKDDLASKRLELIELREKISRTANPDRRASLEVREDKVKQEVQDLVNRIQELAESYRS